MPLLHRETGCDAAQKLVAVGPSTGVDKRHVRHDQGVDFLANSTTDAHDALPRWLWLTTLIRLWLRIFLRVRCLTVPFILRRHALAASFRFPPL